MSFCKSLLILGTVTVLGCGHLPPSATTVIEPSRPVPSKAAFSEQVLYPLAKQTAHEIIEHKKATYRLDEMRNPDDQAILGAIGGAVPMLGVLFGATDEHDRATLERNLAWLDSRRLPLKKELIGLWESRIESTGTGYAVCVDGKKRVYQNSKNHWVRLDDLPHDCPRVEFQSLKADAPKD
ncbi:MAG: hypothetical protein HZB35_00620 [Nitrospirae bacterium]|nr:hypothetical protein [Nitrospirota bacterium]